MAHAPGGRPRHPALNALWSILTVGIYRYWWLRAAHVEVYDRFELSREGRDDGTDTLFLSAMLRSPLFLLTYRLIFLENVNHLAERLGMRPRISRGAFLGAFLLGGLLVLCGALGLFSALEAAADPSAPAWSPTTRRALLGLGVAGLLLRAVAYARLQQTINGIWDTAGAEAARNAPPQTP